MALPNDADKYIDACFSKCIDDVIDKYIFSKNVSVMLSKNISITVFIKPVSIVVHKYWKSYR